MLFCLSANHRNTEFGLLDRLSRVADDSAAATLTDHDHVRGAVVLATCNRFEAYLDVDDVAATTGALRDAVLAALPDLTEADADGLRGGVETLTGDAVVRHLFAVSSGLESMVLGEDQITGQVQRSLQAAREAGTATPSLEQVFQRAARATRDVRARGDLGAAGRSLARVALDMVETRLTDWSATRVLVVGTGQYAATTVAALRARGADDITVFSASGRASQFAARYDLAARHDLHAALAEADLVITCTATDAVGAEHVSAGRRRMIVDLGLPRNVDPAVGDVEGVDLLDLELIGRHAALPELAESGAHEVVGSHALRFTSERDAAPAVVAVRAHIQEAVDAELARLRPEDPSASATAAALRHLAGVLSHTPSVRAREYAAAGRLEEFEAALETVFGVQVAPAVADERDRRAAG